MHVFKKRGAGQWGRVLKLGSPLSRIREKGVPGLGGGGGLSRGDLRPVRRDVPTYSPGRSRRCEPSPHQAALTTLRPHQPGLDLGARWVHTFRAKALQERARCFALFCLRILVTLFPTRWTAWSSRCCAEVLQIHAVTGNWVQLPPPPPYSSEPPPGYRSPGAVSLYGEAASCRLRCAGKRR